MNKVIIHKNPNGDTRTAPKDIAFEQFEEANSSHINDVDEVMNAIASKLRNNGIIHDWTKKSEEAMFCRDFLATLNGGKDFVSGE